MHWADGRVWKAILDSSVAASDPNLRDRLYHSHFTQRAFLQVWTRQPVPRFNSKEFATPTELEPWARSYYGDVAAFLDTLDDSRLNESMSVPWERLFEKALGKKPAPATFGETLFQVTAHTNYHRGQINTRLRQLEVKTPDVDYIAWVWIGKPVPEWPVTTPT
jgi:uncharacterized damage-inducible protein DinB